MFRQYVFFAISICLFSVVHTQNLLEDVSVTKLIEPLASKLSFSRDENSVTTNTVSPSDAWRVRLNPAGLRVVEDPDWPVWTVETDVSSVSTVINGVTLTLSVPGDAVLDGSRYKLVQQAAVAGMGEKMIGEGITANTTDGKAVTLTLTGLTQGTHTLLTYHNAWDNIPSAAALSISVDGETVIANQTQTIRCNNMWDTGSSYVTFSVNETDQEVQIVYTPGSSGDQRAFLNGFEFDTPDIDAEVGFPYPHHLDEHLDLQGATNVTASWRAPKSTGSPTYNAFLGTTNTTLESVATGLTSSSTTFSGLNTDDFYYWRVDVVSGNSTSVGRIFTFRVAHLAFPGAEGWGRFARGGRGGKVVKVTSLEDTTDEGTLRYALTVATGPRTVVFDVGGVITTTSRMTVNGKYITVAGQTAPGKGIAVQGWPIGLSGASDVIFRHMRVRPGKISGETVDGMGMAGSNHCVFDHCSVGWTIDESFSSRAAHNITLQRSMISEPLNVAGHKNYPNGTAHGFAASIGGDVGSFHHNLIAHAEGRSWSMAGGLDDAAAFAGRLDIRNNVVYNFGSRVTDGGAHQVNFVGNYYKPGPASDPDYDLRAQYEDQAEGSQTYYCAGNSMVNVFNETSTQQIDDGEGQASAIACWADISISPAPAYQKFAAAAFFEPHVATQGAAEAYKRVLSDSGCSQPAADEHDARIAAETRAGTYTYVGSASGQKGLIDDPADAGGLEDFPAAARDPAAWDADGDGIADWWDGETGGDGYTPLEGYVNFMAEPHVFVAPSGTVEVGLAPLAAGFVSPSFVVSGATKGSVTVGDVGVVATYLAGAAAGIDYFRVAIEDSEGSLWERTVGVAIYDGAE
ncbi:pectate lyase [Biscogniauxia mediterranea]|nr:pectate lyase [Biscogniauxia mediterranea]